MWLPHTVVTWDYTLSFRLDCESARVGFLIAVVYAEGSAPNDADREDIP